MMSSPHFTYLENLSIPNINGFSSLNLQWLKRRGDVAAWHFRRVAMPCFVKPCHDHMARLVIFQRWSAYATDLLELTASQQVLRQKSICVWEKNAFMADFFTLAPASFFGSVGQSNKQILPCGTPATFSRNIQLFLFLSMRPLMNTFFLLTWTFVHAHVPVLSCSACTSCWTASAKWRSSPQQEAVWATRPLDKLYP